MEAEDKKYELVYFYPERHELHFENGHPERPERVEAIVSALDAADLWEAYPHINPISPPQHVLAGVHNPDYLTAASEASKRGMRLDMDTYTRPESWELALQSAGGLMSVASAVWEGKARRGFALTRPPGHHATSGRGMGFCLLNNAALAAQYLLGECGAKKIAIIDVDLHHGNGTQDIFWERGDVFYLSTHQSPLYPGSGHLGETGSGDGEGETANLPLPPASGDRAFSAATEEWILPLLQRRQPEMLLVSFGFDPHWRDPLGHLRLSAAGMRRLIEALRAWADENCNGRIALTLEGGYDLDAAGACAHAAVSGLLGSEFEDRLGPSPRPEGSSWEKTLQEARDIWAL